MIVETVLISMGSNLSPRKNLVRAKAMLATMEELELLGSSRVYETPPAVGATGPTFLNAALAIRTALDPIELKYGLLRPLESRLGRERGPDRNAPRTIDLDIAYFGDRVLDDPEAGIVIPDPDALSWAHVALPLADLAPERIHPVDGRRLTDIARGVEDADRVQVIAADIDALAEI